MSWYAWFLAVTLGADSFDTRDLWTDILSAPLLRPLVIPALWNSDPEVNYRVRLITGVNLPEWARDPVELKTVSDLWGDPHDALQIEKLAAYYGDQLLDGGKAGYRIERLARELNLVPQGCVMPWGTPAARRWIYWCRASHAGLNPEGSPCMPTDFQIPIPMPRVKP